MKSKSESLNNLLKKIAEEREPFLRFHDAVYSYFINSQTLMGGDFPPVYTVKKRIKSEASIKSKIARKKRKNIILTTENIFHEITDLCGIRILHLNLKQFEIIHNFILQQVKNKDWAFVEKPKAFYWDPDLADYYKKLNLLVEHRETLYTSVHYIIKPNKKDSYVSCEIQVRSLIEEVWGEVDHHLNYPIKTTNIHCKEQLRVLSKLVGAGSRLIDSIFKSHEIE